VPTDASRKAKDRRPEQIAQNVCTKTVKKITSYKKSAILSVVKALSRRRDNRLRVTPGFQKLPNDPRRTGVVTAIR